MTTQAEIIHVLKTHNAAKLNDIIKKETVYTSFPAQYRATTHYDYETERARYEKETNDYYASCTSSGSLAASFESYEEWQRSHPSILSSRERTEKTQDGVRVCWELLLAPIKIEEVNKEIALQALMDAIFTNANEPFNEENLIQIIEAAAKLLTNIMRPRSNAENELTQAVYNAAMKRVSDQNLIDALYAASPTGLVDKKGRAMLKNFIDWMAKDNTVSIDKATGHISFGPASENEIGTVLSDYPILRGKYTVPNINYKSLEANKIQENDNIIPKWCAIDEHIKSKQSTNKGFHLRYASASKHSSEEIHGAWNLLKDRYKFK